MLGRSEELGGSERLAKGTPVLWDLIFERCSKNSLYEHFYQLPIL